MPKESTYPKKTSIDDNDFIRSVSEENESVLVQNSVMKQYLGEGTATPYIDVVDIGDDKGLIFTEQISVGTPANPKESVFGAGDSYGVGKEDTTPGGIPKVGSAWHCDAATTIGQIITGATDTTNIMSSDTGSTIGLFGGITAGKYCLLGSDYPFQGVKAKITTAGDTNPDYLIGERLASVGLGWQADYFMATDSNFPYTQKGHHIAETDNSSEQWRFGFDPLELPQIWEKVTLNINSVDYTKYWARFRIIQSIVTDPIIEQLKLHTNRFEINSDGTEERFGLSRVKKSLIFGLSNSIPNAINDPADESVDYGSNFSAKYKDNEFQAGRKDGFGIVQGIDEGLDTSIPLVLSVSYYVKGTNTGIVEFQAEAFQVEDGFVYDGNAIPNTYSKTDTIVVSSDTIRKTIQFSIRVNKLIPTNGVVISLYRDAGEGADSLNNSVVITNVALSGYFWK